MSIEKQKANTTAIKKAISTLEVVTYDTVAALIPEMLVKQSLILDISAYSPADPNVTHGVGRFLVYEHQEEGNQFSIWAFAFAPRQKTTIHDHQYKGTVTVLAHTLSEKYYTPVDEQQAELSARSDRYPFHSNQDNMDIPNRAHQLKYRKAQATYGTVAVSLHIYNMPAFKTVEQHNRNLLSIFAKKPLDTNKPRPIYIPLGAPVKIEDGGQELEEGLEEGAILKGIGL